MDSDLKYLITPQAGILLPGGQAFMSAFAVGVVTGSLAWLFHAENPLAIAGVASGVGFGYAWLMGLSWWKNRVQGLQKAQQPIIYPASTTRVELVQSEAEGVYLRGAWFDLPIDKEKMITACQHIERNNFDFSMISNSGRGKPLSRSEYTGLRDTLRMQALADWVNEDAHAQGVRLNGAGRSFVRKWAIMAPTTPQSASMGDIRRISL